MAVHVATDENFETLSATTPVSVVKYYADWCGSCKLFAPKFKRLSDEEGYSEVTFIEVNAETSPETRKLGGVSNLPYIAVFRNGSLIGSAATNKEEVVRELLSAAI